MAYRPGYRVDLVALTDRPVKKLFPGADTLLALFDAVIAGMPLSSMMWIRSIYVDVAHQRNMNTDLQLDSKLVKCGVNLRMKQ
jgi:hypothetical protein